MKESSPNQRLRSIRELLKFNQTEFSNALGFKQSHISAIESEKKEVSVNIIYAIVNKFKVSANWLLTGTGEMFLTHQDRIEYPDQPAYNYSFDASSYLEADKSDPLEFIITEAELNNRIKELELCIIKEGYLPLFHLCELYAQLLNQPPNYSVLEKNPLPNTVDIPANALSPILTLDYSLSIFENKVLYFKELERVFSCWRQEFYSLFDKLYTLFMQQENSRQTLNTSHTEEPEH